MRRAPARSRRRERGVTMLVTVVLLLLVGLLVLTTIAHSGSESSSGAQARNTTRALHAADGGLQMAIARLARQPADPSPIDTTIGIYSVESRTRADATPQALDSKGKGPPPEGYGLNAGSGYSSEIFLVDITAEGGGGATAEIQGKVRRFDGASGGYQ